MLAEVVGVVASVVPAIVRAGREVRMGKASRDKGARGEREIARLLQPHMPDGWKVRRALPFEHGHDLRIVDQLGNPVPGGWAIECKRYADCSVGEVLRGPSVRWLEWWQQTQRQAEMVGRAPMLVTRGDRRPWWCWTEHSWPVVPSVEIPTSSGIVCGALLETVLDDLQHGIGSRVLG